MGALEALDCGVTTILDPADGCQSPEHSEAGLKGLRDAGIRGFFAFGMSDDTYGKSARGEEGHKARMAHVERLRASSVADDDRLVDVGLSISHPGTVPFDFTAKELRYAREHDMLCCSHSAAMKTSNLCHGIIERADHDLMYPGHVYIHCTDLSDSELDLIAKTGGKISIAPATEMQMGMGMLPLRACLDHDIPISLSLDTTSAAAPELLSQARLALQLQRCLDNEASHDQRKMPWAVSLTVRDALTWVTRMVQMRWD